MQNRKWIKHTIGAMPRLAENKDVLIYINNGSGLFMMFTGYHEGGVWFIYDINRKKYRPYRRQQFVTHYKHLPTFPNKEWLKIDALKPTNNPLLLRNNDGIVFVAHQESGIWIVYDAFEQRFEPYHWQSNITNYMKLPELPKG